VTAAAELGPTDRAAARSREELRLVELASGLLLLLDAYRLTGRLPLEVQVQTSRLRHAVKLAVQAEAARTTIRPPAPPRQEFASRDEAARPPTRPIPSAGAAPPAPPGCLRRPAAPGRW